MTFFQFMEKFSTEEKVINYWINIRYPDGIKCNHCGSVHVYQVKDRPKNFYCGDCINHFSVFKDTIFEKSSTDLRKWFYAIHLFLNAKKGISAKQLQRETGVTYKTAWRMLQQIRIAMGNQGNPEFFETIIEMDETYVGGKPRKRNTKNNDDDKTNKRGRGTSKTPVVGVVDRNDKKVHARVALPNNKGQKLTGKQLLNILNDVCDFDSKNVIMTDEFRGYNILNKEKKCIRFYVDHQKKYANGMIHTNTIESFWAIVKRAIYGIYHHVSVKYLQRYIDEFCFRYNNRELSFNQLLVQAIL